MMDGATVAALTEATSLMISSQCWAG